MVGLVVAGCGGDGDEPADSATVAEESTTASAEQETVPLGTVTAVSFETSDGSEGAYQLYVSEHHQRGDSDASSHGRPVAARR